MSSRAGDHYLTSQVLTATPAQLRLLLIEGALRFASQAQHLRQKQRNGEAAEAIVRCQEIVSELIASAAAARSDVGRKVASVYLYVHRRLSDAQRSTDSGSLDDVLRILRVERETWQTVCRQLGPGGSAATEEPLPADRRAGESPHKGGCLERNAGFSVEA